MRGEGRRHLVVVCAASVLVCGFCARILTAPAETNYFVGSWAVKDGLPHPSVRWLAQTPDRLLWVGTALGLARFDGARFKVFDPTSTPALGDARIKTLCVDPDGALWVLGENGDVVRRGTASAGATEVIEGLDDLVVFNFLGSTVAPAWTVVSACSSDVWPPVGDSLFTVLTVMVAASDETAKASVQRINEESLFIKLQKMNRIRNVRVVS